MNKSTFLILLLMFCFNRDDAEIEYISSAFRTHCCTHPNFNYFKNDIEFFDCYEFVRTISGFSKTLAIHRSGEAIELPKVTIERLEKVVVLLEESEKINISDTCGICFESFSENEDLAKLPCGHIFHNDHIRQWIVTDHNTCPMCRVEINDALE